MRSQRKNPSYPCFHQRLVHWILPPQGPTLRYDPIYGVASDWLHLRLRKWGVVTKAAFKPSIFSSKLALSTTAHLASLQFQICSLKEFVHPLSLLSLNYSSPLEIYERPICFSRRQIGRKEIFSLLSSSYVTLWGRKRQNISKLQEASPEKSLYCFSTETALQTIP